MPGAVVYVQKTDFHWISILCLAIVVKYALWLVQMVFSFSVLHRSKIPLVCLNEVANMRSLLFRQWDGAL